jgi:itaconate CoA-transferase
MTPDQPQTLDGITVVALEQAVAGPFASRQLADLGARVIKVERPEVGDFARGYDRTVHGQSSYFVWLNRGKQSIELDIKDDDDRALLLRIIDGADVVLQNLVPCAVDRLGLDAGSLRRRRPELIHCSISGYGATGPYGEKKAYDLMVQCEAGLLQVTGTPAQPVKAGISIADIATGMYAYAGILAALYERNHTGVGSTLEIAMIDALGEWMTQPAYFSTYGGQPAKRTGACHASIAPYGPYRAGDGSSLFIAVQNDREWAALAGNVLTSPDLIADPRFAHNPERVTNDDQITVIIEEWLSTTTADDAIRLLDRSGIASAQMRAPADLLTHPQLEARDRWRQVATPGGAVQAMTAPITVRGRESRMQDVPALGQHNSEIRDEFG